MPALFGCTIAVCSQIRIFRVSPSRIRVSIFIAVASVSYRTASLIFVSRSFREGVVKVGVFTLEFDRFAGDKEMLHMAEQFERITVGDDNVCDLPLLNAADLVRDVQNLRWIKRDGL